MKGAISSIKLHKGETKMENKLLLSATEVSNLLGLSRPSVYQLMQVMVIHRFSPKL